MIKKITAIAVAALVAVAIVIGVVAYSYLKPAEAASGPIQAVALTQTSGTTNTTYTIAQASSQATFTIDEVLNGSPKTVVGTTDQVAGQISVNPTAPSTAQIMCVRLSCSSRWL